MISIFNRLPSPISKYPSTEENESQSTEQETILKLLTILELVNSNILGDFPFTASVSGLYIGQVESRRRT